MLQKVVCLMVLVCMVVINTPHAEAAITCGQVITFVTPCIPYLRTGGAVPASCCNGARSLNSAASTTLDRRSACTCLVSASKSIPGINLGNANKLPGLCGLKLPYQIGPSTDCSKIK